MDVYVIGNGFDLQHLLPTKYINFLNVVNFLINHYDKENMKTVGDVFSNSFLQSNDNDITKSYNEHKSIYDTVELDSLKIEELIEQAKNNIWFQYFSNSYNKELGWIDFEKEVSEVVTAFSKFLKKGKTSFSVENTLDDFKQKFIIYRFDFFYNIGNSTWATTGERTKEVKKEFKVETPMGSNHFEIDKIKIAKELYNALRECGEILKKYLTFFVDNLTGNQNFMCRYFQPNRFNWHDEIISFNYTNTIKNICIASVHHIHGRTNEKIVLGINPNECDELDSIDTLFISFKKYYQRVFYKTDIEALSVIKEMKREKQRTKDVCLNVIGHSLDVTDEDILKELILSSNKINIYYHSEEAVGRYIENLIKMFGKKEFDRIRSENDLGFVKQSSTIYNREESILCEKG